MYWKKKRVKTQTLKLNDQQTIKRSMDTMTGANPKEVL